MALMTDMFRRRKLNELISSWVEYRDMVARHAGHTQATPDQEQAFLELKASISSRMPLLSEFAAGQGSLNQELQAHVRGMTDLMNRYLTLNTNGSFTDAEREDFMTKWHSHFLYLNRFKGIQAQGSRENRGRASVAPMSGSMPYSTWGGRRLVSGLFDNWLTRFVVRAAIVVILVVIAARLTNFDFSNAGESAKRIYNEWWGPRGTSSGQVAVVVPNPQAGKTEATTPKTNSAGTTALTDKEKKSNSTVMIGPGSSNRAKYRVDGTGNFVAPQGPNPLQKALSVIHDITPRPLRDFMHPVTEQWGVEATVALVGVGLLLVAYMLFGRAR